MIPKVIHYCWFGGKEKPDSVRQCIDTWKKYCPDYEIKEWNESNFDVTKFRYTNEAFNERKWAFITDYVRLYALVNEGGIYMDTDVEVIKELDEFLCYEAFSGFQTEDSIPTGIMASEKGYFMFKKLLSDYDNRSLYNSDGTLNLTTNVEYITEEYLKYGLVLNNKFQVIKGFALYPVDYFCAKSWITGIINRTNNTHSIHHFSGSWLNTEEKKLLEVNRYCMAHFGALGKLFFLFYKYLFHPKNILKKIFYKREY